jgi:putative oxidoreductase
LFSTIGCLLVGGLFVFAGIDHFRRFGAVEAMLDARGWPRPGLWLGAASVFQVVAGLGVILDIARVYAALGLAAFTVAASVTLLDYWRFEGAQRDGMRSGFVANWGVLGGLLLAAGTGA